MVNGTPASHLASKAACRAQVSSEANCRLRRFSTSTRNSTVNFSWILVSFIMEASQVIIRVGPDSGEPRGQSDEVIGQLLRRNPVETASVEPLIDFRIVFPGDGDLREGAGEDGVAESERH